MYKLLYFLFMGDWPVPPHQHEWEMMMKNPLDIKKTDGDKEVVVCTGTRYTLRCKTCGDIVKRDII